ncbi:hypothetical protein [uncultured Methylobacterium sp.]|uniref:hypothetical protein n=1 Tax=uncultured Methylobacterium sp. TaxID=157278 RepID=UPI002624ADD5|nr:hypothetical protein [uncultured Methylobacterium sp.]
MALTHFQREVLIRLSRNRSPDSVFAGGTVANRNGARISQDFDIEHGTTDAVLRSSRQDQATLLAAGYEVEETPASRPDTGFVEVECRKDGHSLLLDWMQDTTIRFFPAVEDADFGWRLHDADVALNKLLALAGRRAARDYYDVVTLHERGLPLVALAWAALGKDAGMTPELVLDEAVRNSRYSAAHLESEIVVNGVLDPVPLKRSFLEAVAEARDLLPRLTSEIPETVGRLSLGLDGRVVVPDPDAYRRGRMIFHPASAGGTWPHALGRNPTPDPPRTP